MIPTEAVDALAAYRLTRLVTADVILDRPRAWVIRKAYEHRDGPVPRTTFTPRMWNETAIEDDEAPKLAELIVCRWCAGAYISFVVVLLRRYNARAWDPFARALALSAAAALLARLED